MKKILTKSIFAFIAGSIFGVLLLIFIKNEAISNKPEIILDYPFLGFLIILILALLFYDYILKLFNKGEIIIKWGNTEISLKELPDKIEQEVSDQLETQDEKAKGKLSLEMEKSQLPNPGVIEKIKSEFGIIDNDVANIVFQLGDSEFKWRKLYTISKRIGIEPDKVDDLIKQRPELIVRGVGKNGVICKLNDYIKTLYNLKFK